jgi:tetratricopeptide (TPR) repeat protein
MTGAPPSTGLGTPDVECAWHESERRLLRQLRADPHSLEHYRALCELEMRRGRTGKARLAIERALRLAPTLPDLVKQAADVYRAGGQWRQAAAHLRRAIALGRADVDALVSLLQCQLAGGSRTSAGATLDLLTQKFADCSETWLAGAHLKKTAGDLTGALAAYREALVRAPLSGQGWYGLVELAPSDPATRDLLAMPVDRWQALTDPERALLSFARGRLYERAGDYDSAFQAIADANEACARHLRDSGLGYSPGELESDNRELLRLHPGHPSLEHTDFGVRPIFIVGMPRSGTTLVEQILSNHPQVAAGGELIILSELHEQFVERRGGFAQAGAVDPCRHRRDRELLAEMRERYVEYLFSLGLDRPFVTDKFPGNFRLLGFARALFPEAPIVHCRRHAMATLWSLYSTPLSLHAAYRASLDHLAHFYEQYRAMMRTWAERVPLVELDYEDLVRSPDRRIPVLLRECGLSWHERCLAPHENPAPVVTASAVEVRRPIYTSAAERWRRYANHLARWERALA